MDTQQLAVLEGLAERAVATPNSSRPYLTERKLCFTCAGSRRQPQAMTFLLWVCFVEAQLSLGRWQRWQVFRLLNGTEL